jgi:uncharacterized protein (TIGR02996 family)
MSLRQALLRAIIDDPDADVHRLVYADWLDENGDTEADRARAAFIRLQIEAARLDRYDPRRLDLEAQAETLLKGHCEAWLSGLEGWAVNQHPTSFERGFPFVVRAGVAQLLDRGAELWAAAPFRQVALWSEWREQESDERRFPELARCAHLARVRMLGLWGVPSSTGALASLLASPHLAALESLVGLAPPSDQPWLAALLASPLRRALTGLSLATFHPAEDTRALAESGLLGRLRRLGFHGRRPWGADASQALAAGPTDRLESLGWVAAALDGPALRALAACRLPALTRLDFGNNNFTPDARAALTEWLASDRLPSLTTLEFGYCGLSAADAAALAACPGLARLRELELTGSHIRDAGARALAASPHLAGLRVLRLGSNGIRGPGARALAESPHLAGLRVLEIWGNTTMAAAAEKALHRRFGPGVVR